MLEKKERNMLFPDHSVNFSSAGPGAPHFQSTTDFTPSSYFFDMNILEETSTKRKFSNLDGKNYPGVSSVLSGNNQYYDKYNFSVGRQAEYERINKVLLSNSRQPFFQHKDPSFFHETYKEEVSNLRDVDHIGRARHLEPSGFRSEYSRDLVRTFLHDKQQHGMVIPLLPVVLESSSYAEVPLGKERLKNSAYTSKELENIYLGKQDETTVEPSTGPLAERSLCVNASFSGERFTENGDGVSANMDEQNRTTNRRVSPKISEKIWDGSLKLNTSTTVSAVAFFKSGEKVQNLNWPAHIEIKGKVRLQAFEKFIQELPRSRNRALMVISLCWKVGSCRTDLAGMMEVAKGYRETERVGFAQIRPGIDLYVCPRSDIIITILAKYGFFKGMAAVEEDQDSLIGCVVWRRTQSSTNYVSKDTVGKKSLVEEQPLNSTGPSIPGMNSSPAMESGECEKKQGMPGDTELRAEADARSMIVETEAAISSSNLNSSILHCSAAQTMAQQKTSEKASLNLLLQENMKLTHIIPLAQSSGEDEAVLVSDSLTQFVSPSQMSHVFMPGSSFSSSVSQSHGNFGSGPSPGPRALIPVDSSQSHGNFGSGPAPGPRPLIPVDSSNFQFRPQLPQKTNSSAGNDSGRNLAPSFQEAQPSLLPGPPPLSLELLRRLFQSDENAPKAFINGGMLQDEIRIKNHVVTRGPSDVSETGAPSLPQIQKTRDSSSGEGEEEEEDEDDLPEFDFNSACGGEPEAPVSRFPERSKQTHFPNAPPPKEKPSSWSAGDPTPLAAGTKSFEALQHNRPNPPALSINLLNSNEGLLLAQNYGKFISEKTPSTDGYHHQSPCQPSCLKETKDLGNNPRHGFTFRRKSLWEDDDDDMPEWCPPDLELPKQPLPKPLPLPDTTSPLSFHPRQSHDLQQRSHHGLLGPCPSSEAPAGGPAQTRPAGEFLQSSNPSDPPPLGSRRRDSFRPHGSKFNRRPAPYAAGGRRHRR